MWIPWVCYSGTNSVNPKAFISSKSWDKTHFLQHNKPLKNKCLPKPWSCQIFITELDFKIVMAYPFSWYLISVEYRIEILFVMLVFKNIIGYYPMKNINPDNYSCLFWSFWNNWQSLRRSFGKNLFVSNTKRAKIRHRSVFYQVRKWRYWW